MINAVQVIQRSNFKFPFFKKKKSKILRKSQGTRVERGAHIKSASCQAASLHYLVYRQINGPTQLTHKVKTFDAISTVGSLIRSYPTLGAHSLEYRTHQQLASVNNHVAQSHLMNLQATTSITYVIIIVWI